MSAVSLPRPNEEWTRTTDGRRVLVITSPSNGFVLVRFPASAIGSEEPCAVEDLVRPEPRLALVEHMREQIAASPERFANDRKLGAIADKIAGEINSARDVGFVGEQVERELREELS